MVETTPTRRRSRWQIIAAKKYPRMLYIGGDGRYNETGDPVECWTALTKCPHDQTKLWRYGLYADKPAAEAAVERWNTNRCSYQCQGKAEHSLWLIHPQ